MLRHAMMVPAPGEAPGTAGIGFGMPHVWWYGSYGTMFWSHATGLESGVVAAPNAIRPELAMAAKAPVTRSRRMLRMRAFVRVRRDVKVAEGLISYPSANERASRGIPDTGSAMVY
ncbi:hypothetical protein MMAD_54460 [Mycolicibacterium madagascariense]|uniref:Uncharacterized protein n=1 Tax=Mycolicibacterium madagascariense TaxID=212765 RepID=A0A7I7XPH0_9MYCO|nr:hypothetical protein MMAD_54460 [Mycolicibacterium madagascariense]